MIGLFDDFFFKPSWKDLALSGAQEQQGKQGKETYQFYDCTDLMLHVK